MQNNKFGQIGHARLSLLLIMLIAFSQVFLPASGADPIAAPATPSAKSPGLTRRTVLFRQPWQHKTSILLPARSALLIQV